MKTFKILTALITPFDNNKNIDYCSLRKIIRQQLNQKVDGFIVCGTTAEVSCLEVYERFDILRFVLNEVKQKVPVWFGCGSNHTLNTLHMVKKASYYNIAGVLLVTPYYNKPSQQGLYEHFSTIAKSTDLNIMLYQVPSRCGVYFEKETLRMLFQECNNIVALKHACDDYDIIDDLQKEFQQISFYSGEDNSFHLGIEKGISGLISVASHFDLQVIQKFIQTRDEELLKIIVDVANHVFLECSPSAIKYILMKRNCCNNILRLPLVPISNENAKKIDEFLRRYDKQIQNFEL